MAIKLMYITNRTDVALIAESVGVDRIFIDMEYIGKADRQGGMDTVQSHHTVEDIKAIRSVVKKSDIMVRVNPIHDGSREEIDAVVAAGADIIMLPYFKTANEVKTFVELVGGRAKTLPLVETPEAVSVIDEILEIGGIDEIFVGLNDLSLGYGKKFMFELLADGTVESLCLKFKQKGIPYVNNKNRRGDLYFDVNIEIPKGLNEKQKAKMREFADACGDSNYSKKTGFFKRIFDKK